MLPDVAEEAWLAPSKLIAMLHVDLASVTRHFGVLLPASGIGAGQVSAGK